MHIELVDSLRCPEPHDDTWLVASVTRFDGRDIVEGALGCPICRRQFVVSRGEVGFAGEAPAEGGESGSSIAPPVPDGDDVLRARALLALDEPGGIVLLGGVLAWLAQPLSDDAQVTPILLNAPAWAWSDTVAPSAVRAHASLPFAGGSLRAVWLDAATATPSLLAGAARALRPGGRLVAPVAAALPAGVRQLASDSQVWVAESAGAPSAPVPLRRR